MSWNWQQAIKGLLYNGKQMLKELQSSIKKVK